jgi:hypothetical protein
VVSTVSDWRQLVLQSIDSLEILAKAHNCCYLSGQPILSHTPPDIYHCLKSCACSRNTSSLRSQIDQPLSFLAINSAKGPCQFLLTYSPHTASKATRNLPPVGARIPCARAGTPQFHTKNHPLREIVKKQLLSILF